MTNPKPSNPPGSNGILRGQIVQTDADTITAPDNIVQTVTADLQKAGVTSDVFRTVQRHGYLRDWEQERWLQAEQELAQARLLQARQRYQAMGRTSMQQLMGGEDGKRSGP